MSYYSEKERRTMLDILIIAAVIFGFIAIVFILNDAYGQVQNVTSPPAPPPQVLDQVVEQVPTIAEKVDTNSTTNTLIGTVVTGIGGYITTKFLKDRKDKSKIEEYSSTTDRIIFNHVMDNYNDFTNYCKIRRKYLELLVDPANKGKPELDILSMVADKVSGRTYLQIEAEHLDNIIGWNTEYYGAPSTDPNIVCPDPKNKIARTMTDIKRFSVPNTINTDDTQTPTTN